MKTDKAEEKPTLGAMRAAEIIVAMHPEMWKEENRTYKIIAEIIDAETGLKDLKDSLEWISNHADVGEIVEMARNVLRKHEGKTP